ncbi:MAG: hypothetical protein M9890_07795 [Thermomicrobiales bacterium]|nr:hypothetical protein [Thermomicrobiales bacterium]
MIASQPAEALMADFARHHTQETVTSLVYQPLPPWVPVHVGRMTGAVGERLERALMSQAVPSGRSTPR